MEAGDFVLVLPYDPNTLPYFALDNYLYLRGTQYLMVIESVEIDKTEENGIELTVSGRSYESKLDRRVMDQRYNYPETSEAQDILLDLVRTQLINSENTSRNVSDLSVVKTTYAADDRVRTQMALAGYGDNLYELICEICSMLLIGFRILYNGEDGVIFEVYQGVDRSYDQGARPPVIFSETYGNLTSAKWLASSTEVKNAAFVWSDTNEETGEALAVELSSGATGWARRELFYEDTSVDPTEGTEEELITSGKLELANHDISEAFECELDPRPQFEYGVDYFLGDLVQVVTSFGIERTVMVTEVVRSWDENGKTVVPTFMVMEG